MVVVTLHPAYVSSSMAPPYEIADWQIAAAEKRAALQALIPKSHLLPTSLAKLANQSLLLPEDPRVLSCGILTTLDLEITNHEDAAVLLASIAGGTYTAMQVVDAFCKRASIAQQCTGCLTEIMYESALERARELDALVKSGGKVGVLHGLPISLKVCANSSYELPKTYETRIVMMLKVCVQVLGLCPGFQIVRRRQVMLDEELWPLVGSCTVKQLVHKV
jgi:hypothetical protein